MAKELVYEYKDKFEIDSNKVRKEELETLLDFRKKTDAFVLRNYYLGNIEEEFINIEGSYNLIETYKRIEEKVCKVDIIERLGNVRYIGKSEESDNIIFNINNEYIAECIYNARNDFFQGLFEIDKFLNFCFKARLDDLISYNIKYLMEEFPDKERQYRLIKERDRWCIRSVTSSNKYKNYDNKLVLYMSLYILHKLGVEKDINFKVSEYYLSDSSMRLFFEERKEYILDDNNTLNFGLLIKNSEIKNESFTVDLYYKIINKENKDIGFIGIHDFKEKLFSVKHNISEKSLISKFNNILDIEKYKNEVLAYVDDIINADELTDVILDRIVNEVVKVKNKFTLETREEIRKLKDQQFAERSIKLMDALNKINMLDLDIDEKIYLQYIYDKAITDTTKGRRR
ncbi:MAG: hypothetical protein ACRCVJ_07000 [Clostridium sp.]|uniref:hypothetical protein n=1 Tax=Clostridium sp. TaxID=1506 RepID=UPI003F359D0C